ncbi:hypothetical protein AHiyo6_19530 [Arthrobacter sp. Hiyo6]|nr:hypothetical protein AHiyo6_19530 [Arthrobacter sp. Hiyo6]
MVVQDHHRLGELLRNDDEVLGGRLNALSAQDNVDFAARLKLCRNGNHGGLGEVLPGVGRNPVLGDARGADALVLATHGFDRNCVRSRDGDGRGRTDEGLGVESTETLERCEPPVFLHAGQRLEISQLVGRQAAGA